jgi:hypothetical protein
MQIFGDFHFYTTSILVLYCLLPSGIYGKTGSISSNNSFMELIAELISSLSSVLPQLYPPITGLVYVDLRPVELMNTQTGTDW